MPRKMTNISDIKEEEKSLKSNEMYANGVRMKVGM